MRSLDDITRDLAQVTDELLALPADDFGGRYELLTRQDQLRREADRFQADFDEQRPAAEISSELAEVRKRRDAAIAHNTVRVMASGPGGTGGAAAAVSASMVRLSMQAKASSPIDALNARVAHLDAVLAARGIDPEAVPRAGTEPALGADPTGA
jgi:hypothetical protein